MKSRASLGDAPAGELGVVQPQPPVGCVETHG